MSRCVVFAGQKKDETFSHFLGDASRFEKETEKKVHSCAEMVSTGNKGHISPSACWGMMSSLKPKVKIQDLIQTEMIQPNESAFLPTVMQLWNRWTIT